MANIEMMVEGGGGAALAAQSLELRRQEAVAPGVATLLPVYAQRARNAEIWDVDGRRYVDFASGIAVLNTGHLHKRVRDAVAGQLEQLSHACFQVTPYESYVQVAERLNAIVPTGTANKTMLLSTGAEAVENAIKIARAYTGRPGVIAFSGAFHGRTMMGMALTGKVVPYKTGFGPFPSEIFHAPFPAEILGVSVEDALAGIERIFASDIEPSRVAAIIIEPVQGEGGFYPAPSPFLAALRAICDRHGIVMIVDEIQTGMARTGRRLAIEHSGVDPDLVTMAKGLAGGFPLSAVTGRQEIMDAAAPGGLGGTYAGSPIACAAALAVLDVIEDEGLCERARIVGERMAHRLQALSEDEDLQGVIAEVRGIGAMVAMELVELDTQAPASSLTKELVQAAGRDGLILLACGVRGNVIRLLPALTIDEETLEEGLDILARNLRALVAQQAVL